MKLLSLRLCEHDSNLSFFDGENVHYYKSERHLQYKHHAFNNLWEWRDIVYDLWNIKHNEIDEISIIIDPWKHNLPCNKEDFFPDYEYEYLPTKSRVYRVNHHYAHALSHWPLQSTDPDISMVFDGFGDFDISYSVFKNNKLICKGSHAIHGSLGTEMASAGRFLNVSAEHGVDIAGKLMSLQSYGKVDQSYLNLISHLSISNVLEIFNFEKYINYKKSELLAHHTALDWIATIHEHCGNILCRFVDQYAKKDDKIFYSGGVAQNVVWNSKLKKQFPNLIIPPHCADDGLSLGGLEFLRKKNNLPKFKLGNFPFCQYTSENIELPDEKTLEKTAYYLAQGKIIGWFQGAGEIGPRALGHRSILMDPRLVNGKDLVNRIKNRENYRPFGATVLREVVSKYFDGAHDEYMLYTTKHLTDKFPAITHVDGTCRIQCIDNNDSFRNLLEKFYKLTGCPILLNTSLNLAGKPLADSKSDAIEIFQNTDLDILVIGNYIYNKDDQ